MSSTRQQASSIAEPRQAVAIAEASRGESVTDTAPPGTGLRQRAISGAAWVVAGMGTRHVLKLVSSLVLTRILFPEAFGLVATVGLLTAALEICSDIGIQQAIVQHREGDRQRYLDSAWTMRVIRGFLLGLLVAALAWPFAAFFEQSILFPIALVSCILPVLRGFTSPAVFLLVRNLELGRLAVLEVISNAIRITGTIVLALLLLNVWALVIGGLIGEVARLFGSFIVRRYRPRLRWDRQAVGSLFRFGRFVLLSSLIGYGATRLDALFVAKFLGMESAGIYYIATALAAMFAGLFTEVSGRVLFPAMSRRQDDPSVLRTRTAEVGRLIAVTVLPLGVLLAVNADLIIGILYDARYAGVAVAMRWLCAAACVDILANALNSPLMATGRPYIGTSAMATRLVILCVAAPVLGQRLGLEGYASAVFLACLGFLAIIVFGCIRHGHASLRTIFAPQVLPLAYGAVVVFTHVVLGIDASDTAGRFLLGALEVALLAALWGYYWRSLREFLPNRRGRMNGVT